MDGKTGATPTLNPRIVSRDELESFHARLRAETSDPRAGVFGPTSAMWGLSREGALFLGAGRALLLQVAHPYVAHAVTQHSRFRQDPLGRFQRTFDGVFGMIFGDLDTALKRSRAVHAVHGHVRGAIDEDVGAFRRGAPYQANDAGALLWVHTTLFHTAMHVYELAVGPIADARRAALYQDSKRFAALFGLGEDDLPADWSAFCAYFDAMVDSPVLRVGVAARELAQQLFHGRGLVRRPLYGWLDAVTACLLPPRLRDEFGYTAGPAQQAVFRSTMLAARSARPFLPPTARYVPAYLHARRRIAGKEGPDRAARLVESVVAGVIAG